jgi:hypothetical protein
MSQAYQDAAQAYAQGVQALLAIAAGGPVAGSGQATGAAQARQVPAGSVSPEGAGRAGGLTKPGLAEQARQLASLSGTLTQVAAAGLAAADPLEREAASARLLAKTLADLEISRRLLAAAQAEEGLLSQPGSSAAGAAAQPGTEEKAPQARPEAKTGALAGSGAVETDMAATLGLLLSGQPLADAAARRAVATLPTDLPTARTQLSETLGETIGAIRDRAGQTGQEAISGMLVLGLSEIARAAGIVGMNIAEALGQAEKVTQLYNLFRQFALNAYESLVALLGPTLAKTATQQAVAWANDVASGKDFGRLIERLYRTEQIQQQLDTLANSSQAGLDRFSKAIQDVDGLSAKFSAQTGMVSQILRGLRLLGGVSAAALPQAKLLLAASYIVIAAYVILAGADYLDADQVKLLARVPGVRQVVEKNLS